MFIHPNYILEIPITAKDARRRKLPRDISKLIIEVSDREEQESETLFFSKFLYALCNSNERIFAQPVGSYYHLDKYETQLKKLNMPCWFDRPYLEKQRKKPSLLTVECDKEGKIDAVFRTFWADAIVFFLARQYEPAGPLETALLKRRSGHGYDEYYLKTLEIYGLFIFYADTHDSLELLGYRDKVMDAFMVALSVEKQELAV